MSLGTQKANGFVVGGGDWACVECLCMTLGNEVRLTFCLDGGKKLEGGKLRGKKLSGKK